MPRNAEGAPRTTETRPHQTELCNQDTVHRGPERASQRFNWEASRDYLTRIGARRPDLPAAGTPEWLALDDNDPAKLHALAKVGLTWVLDQEIAELARRRAMKAAAIEVAQAIDVTATVRAMKARSAKSYVPRVRAVAS